MGKSLIEMAAEIVKSQCQTNSLSSKEISDSLVETYNTLARLSGGSLEEEVSAPITKEPGMPSEVAEETLPAKKEAKPPSEKEVTPPKKTAPEIKPEDSIQQDKIICLECGESFNVLSGRHLQKHNLSSRDYKKKYGFALRQPLCSKDVSEKRKKAGKERGAPENLLKAVEAKKKTGKTKK